MKLTFRKLIPTLAALCALAINGAPARASTAYGSIDNFDVVNDTGTECHGFEIELEDIASHEITYTYDWNHYGKCRLIPSTTAQGRPATCVRWESAKNPDGTWAAYTAIPAGPIAPTDGHQFTNPNVNFGGEHFGAGFTKNPTAARYFWLIDDGFGNLVRGPEVQVSTPVFNYLPPVGGAAAQVQAVIQPVVPEVRPLKEFGDPVWVKEIRTTSHNNNEVKLRDLVSDDPDDPNDKNWRNGEPDEVEVEWQLLQTEFNKLDGGENGELAGAPEELPDGDEVVTRRWEFFKYTGPIDKETGEAKASSVGPDGIHGKGIKTINGVVVDLSTIEVVGDYIGAQMAAFDPAAEVGLIDQLPDGELGIEYPARTVIIAGGAPFTATTEGELPAGMSFDTVTGILSGTPDESGTFSFTVNVQEGTLPVKTKTYSFIISGGEAPPPPQSVVDTSAEPADAGTTTGDGIYDNGTVITVTATPVAGHAFVNWTDNGTVVSDSASYAFVTNVNRSLVAHFAPVVPNFTVSTSASPATLGTTSGGGTYAEGTSVTVTATANAGAAFVAWTEGGNVVSSSASYTFSLSADRALVANFVSVFNITTSASPAAGGTTTGDGAVNDGGSVTVTAAANAGYAFVNWTEGGAEVSTSENYSFTATANRALVANFVPVFTITTAAAPANGGSTSGGGAVNGGTSVTVSATPNPGFAFVNWTDGAIVVSGSASYTFTASADRALVANFQPVVVEVPAGVFKGIVTNPTAPDPAGTGMMSVNVGSAGAFSGKLALGGASHSFKGTFDNAGGAALSIARLGKGALAVTLRYDAASGITGSVSAGTMVSTFTARRCPHSRLNPLAEWPGSYTHMIAIPRHPRTPLPVGVGTHTISALGAVRVSGRLTDGTGYTCASAVTDAGTFPLYSATRKSGFMGFVVGDITLDRTAVGSFIQGSPVDWKAAAPQGIAHCMFYTESYAPPPRGQTALKVDLGVPNLDIAMMDAIGGWLATWQMQLGTNNVAADLHAGPGPISLRIAPRTGVITGRLNDGTVTRPFTGIVWQNGELAFAILPGFGDQASLAITATHTEP